MWLCGLSKQMLPNIHPGRVTVAKTSTRRMRWERFYHMAFTEHQVVFELQRKSSEYTGTSKEVINNSLWSAAFFKKEIRIPVHVPQAIREQTQPVLVYQVWAGTPSLSSGKEDFPSNLQICKSKQAFNPLLIKEFTPSHNSGNDSDFPLLILSSFIWGSQVVFVKRKESKPVGLMSLILLHSELWMDEYEIAKGILNLYPTFFQQKITQPQGFFFSWTQWGFFSDTDYCLKVGSVCLLALVHAVAGKQG